MHVIENAIKPKTYLTKMFLQTIKTNTLGTLNMLGKIVIISSAKGAIVG